MSKEKRFFYVDFENVARKGLEGIEELEKRDCVYIYSSNGNETINLFNYEAMINSKAKIKFRTVKFPIKNSADCMILFHIDKHAPRNNPKKSCSYFIVSNDGDFDVPIKLLREEGIVIRRIASIATRQLEVVQAPKKKAKAASPKSAFDAAPPSARKTYSPMDHVKWTKKELENYLRECFAGTWIEQKIDAICQAVYASKTKLEINNRLMKMFVSEVSGEIYNIIKPFITDFPGN